jgi:hypothetical protein
VSKEISHDRRRFLGIAAMTIAAAEFVMIGSADPQSSKINLAIEGKLPSLGEGESVESEMNIQQLLADQLIQPLFVGSEKRGYGRVVRNPDWDRSLAKGCCKTPILQIRAIEQ